MADKKNTSAQATTTTPAPKKQRKVRTLEERIAELRELQAKKEAKAKEKAQAGYSETLAKYRRAVAQATKFAGQLQELAKEHGFELPTELQPEPVADPIEDGAPTGA